MGGFSEQYSELQKLNTRIIAASTDNIENSTAIAADLPFPVAHAVTREQASTLDSWWEDRRGLIQPSNFILNHEGKVLSATYSSGSVGRLEGLDAVRFITFQEKLRLES